MAVIESPRSDTLLYTVQRPPLQGAGEGACLQNIECTQSRQSCARELCWLEVCDVSVSKKKTSF